MPSLPRTVDLGDVAVALAAEAGWQRTCLDWHFGRLTDHPGPPALRISLRRQPRPQPITGPSMLDGPMRRWQTPAGLTVHHELGAAAHLSGDALLVCGEPAPEVRWRAVRQLLFSALSWRFDQSGLLMLHAAAVGHDGEVALIMGPTGAGKSTCAAAALLAGWEVLSDDLVIVRAGARGPEAFGVPKRMTVEPDLGHRLDVPLEPLPGDPRTRVMLPADVFTVGWRRVRSVLRTDHHPGDGALDVMSHEDALHTVLTSFLEARRPDALRRQLGRVGALAGQPRFTLRLASPPDARLDRAAALLAEAWSCAAVS